jgi:plastocyanin
MRGKLPPVPRERRPILRLIACLAVASAAFGFATAGAQASVAVTIVFRAYQPATTIVALGETVTWTNSTLMPHTVTAVEGAFDSGKMNGGTTFSFTFLKPGTFLYKCTIHPSMKGTVIVRARPASPPTVLVRLSHRAGHPRQRLVHVQVARPGAKVLLEEHRGSSWQILASAHLSSQGTATLRLSRPVHRQLRVVVPGLGSEETLFSRTLAPAG